MTSAVIENLSGRKPVCLCSVLLLTLLAGFLLGGLVAPDPSSSQNILGTICVDHQRDPNGWFQVWSVVGGQGTCDNWRQVDDLIDSGISSEQVVFAFQMPLRRGAMVDFTRWQQNLIGVIQLDIDHDKQYAMLNNASLALDMRLGYKNKGDKTDEWTLLAASVEERHLSCDQDSEHAYRYNCDLLLLFELGSLHHDFYLLNLRLAPNMENQRNVGIGKLVGINLVAIFQNGGFTKVWVSLKTVFFPLVVALVAWFWRRVQALQREPALIECMLFALGISLSVLNLPLEYLTLRYDMPYMLLITDIRQGIFYAVLLSFWLVFAGEHLMVSEDCYRNRLAVYWKHMSAVACGCILLLIFDTCEHGVQLTNPFYSIWGTRVGANLALSFIIVVGVSASLYFCFLSCMIWRVFCNISVKVQALPAISSACRLHHGDIVGRFKFLMLATLTCAAMTVIYFIVGHIAEGNWKWNSEIRLNYTSTIRAGVYVMWNVYTMAVICLYAPSHKRWPSSALADLPGEVGTPSLNRAGGDDLDKIPTGEDQHF